MPPINFNHFYYFYEVARHGSFTRAARELLVAQSAVSVQVKALETALGGPLFDRRRGGVVLTDAGQRAFAVAERVFADVDQLVADLRQSERHVSGGVSVGTVNSIGIYLLPEVLTAFRARFPDVRVRVDFQEFERVLDQLHLGKTDIAIVPWQRGYTELSPIPLTRNKMFLVTPPDHPLARAGKVSPRDLEAYPFVGYQEGMYTRTMIDTLFKRMSINVEYAIESANAATIKHMVMAGMGPGFLPEMAVAGEIRRGQLARLDVPSLTMTQDITLYVRKNRTLPRSASQFVQFLQEYFAPKRPAAARRKV